MKYIFYIGLAGLALFEICKVYFIMPMPGSQQMNTLDLAYFLHTHRWSFRILFALMIAGGAYNAFDVKRKWIPALAMLPLLAIIYTFNFKMLADKMFREPEQVSFKGRQDNAMNDSTVVIAVEHDGIAKAYPLRYIVYHHQVRDTLGSKPIMVTYCSVCRTGRVFEPVVNGKTENFRLVGMDHFNAMFEDLSTQSWWRQATGEAVAGSLAGETLPELQSVQLTAGKFFSMYPFGKVMQADNVFNTKYDSLGRFEKGKSKSSLTGTDTLSWKDKSWIVGIHTNNTDKAYDWNDLKKQRVIHDRLGDTPLIIVLANDGQSFAAFERGEDQKFTVRNDSLMTDNVSYDFNGRTVDPSGDLRRITAYQEFWHSWKTFHPKTDVYESK